MKITLISHSNIDPSYLTALAARICYSSKIPRKNIEPFDVRNKLFKPGHHTPFEHFYLTFIIDKIPVGDITFGLHLVHPFYNSDQRSGRFSAKMFWRPPYEIIRNYIDNNWPEIRSSLIKEILNYIKKEISIFQNNHKRVTELARQFLRQERPFISSENLEKNAPKIAQEQLRVFISVIFPTGLIHTVDLITLASLYQTAWTPGLREVVKQMKEIVVNKFPKLSFMFPEAKYSDWAPPLINNRKDIMTEPSLKLIGIEELENPTFPPPEMIGPLDLLPFSPPFMNNNLIRIETEVEVSLITMGQDQRHRGVHRGMPSFTGNFYLPPLLQEAEMYQEAKEIMRQWFNFRDKIPATLWTLLAPYGAMVKYKKSGPLNAVIHEQNKRLCWLAQEEIYRLSCLMRREIEKVPSYHSYLKLLEPPCFSGKCPEGARYCGRNLQIKDFTTRRKV